MVCKLVLEPLCPFCWPSSSAISINFPLLKHKRHLNCTKNKQKCHHVNPFVAFSCCCCFNPSKRCFNVLGTSYNVSSSTAQLFCVTRGAAVADAEYDREEVESDDLADDGGCDEDDDVIGELSSMLDDDDDWSELASDDRSAANRTRCWNFYLSDNPENQHKHGRKICQLLKNFNKYNRYSNKITIDVDCERSKFKKPKIQQ